MTAAPSQKAREGAAPTKPTGNSHAEQPALNPTTLYRQDIDYQDPGGSKLTPALGLKAKKIRIVSGPVSFRTFAFWGLVIFVAGFLHGRQMRNLATGATQPVTRESAPLAQTATAATPAPTQEITATVTRVTIRLVKFSP